MTDTTPEIPSNPGSTFPREQEEIQRIRAPAAQPSSSTPAQVFGRTKTDILSEPAT